MINASFFKELDRFNIVVKKRVTSSYTGPRRSVLSGRGVMFKDHRIYAPGDDIRSIDWKVYARTDDLYIKNYEEEKNLVVHSITDASASMNFGKSISKFDYAAMLGVGFGYLSLKENEKFQFSTFADKLEVFPPKRGVPHLLSMVDHLNSQKPKGVSRFKDALQQYKKVIGSRALLFIISDFLIPIEEIREALYRIGDHEVNIIQVLDPVEIELSMQGDFRLKDSETGQKMLLHVSQKLKNEYSHMLEDHQGKIQEVCNKLNMKFYSIATETPIFDAFYRILG